MKLNVPVVVRGRDPSVRIRVAASAGKMHRVPAAAVAGDGPFGRRVDAGPQRVRGRRPLPMTVVAVHAHRGPSYGRVVSVRRQVWTTTTTSAVPPPDTLPDENERVVGGRALENVRNARVPWCPFVFARRCLLAENRVLAGPADKTGKTPFTV